MHRRRRFLTETNDDHPEFFARGIEPGDKAVFTLPCQHCVRVCDAKRHADDHLSLVAFLGRLHRRELELNAITTLEALARLTMQI